MEPEVVVEADAEQPPVAADRERDREDEPDHDRDGGADPERPRGPIGEADDCRGDHEEERPIVAVVPWPGSRAKSPVTVRTAPKPTAGSSQDHSSRPQAREGSPGQ